MADKHVKIGTIPDPTQPDGLRPVYAKEGESPIDAMKRIQQHVNKAVEKMEADETRDQKKKGGDLKTPKKYF